MLRPGGALKHGGSKRPFGRQERMVEIIVVVCIVAHHAGLAGSGVGRSGRSSGGCIRLVAQIVVLQCQLVGGVHRLAGQTCGDHLLRLLCLVHAAVSAGAGGAAVQRTDVGVHARRRNAGRRGRLDGRGLRFGIADRRWFCFGGAGIQVEDIAYVKSTSLAGVLHAVENSVEVNGQRKSLLVWLYITGQFKSVSIVNTKT